MAALHSNRQSLLVARDELELVGTANAYNGFSPYAASCSSSSGSSNGPKGVGSGGQCQYSLLHHSQHQQQPNSSMDGGTLSSIRRSLRQINPFKSRLFRLPATPRLSRAKKVLGRGEEFTGWNFERPSYSNHQSNGVGSGQSSANNSLRPLSSSSFGPTEFEYRQQGNVLLHENGRPIQNGGFPGGGGNWGPKSPAAAMGQGTRRFSQAEAAPVPSSFQSSPMFSRRGAPLEDVCSCCSAAGKIGITAGEEIDGLDDLEEFLNAMESISRKGQIGGSCRVIPSSGALRHHEEAPATARFARAGGAATTNAYGPLPLPGPGTKQRHRPPIPSFNAPWHVGNSPPPSATTTQLGSGFNRIHPGSRGSSAFIGTENNNQNKRASDNSPYLQFLPSTCYSPNGEMYAARWRPAGANFPAAGNGEFAGGSPRLQRSIVGRQRPQPLYLPSAAGEYAGRVQQQQQNEQPKSPSQSAITMLSSQQMLGIGGMGMRTGSTVSCSAAVSAVAPIRHKQPRPNEPPLMGASSMAIFPQTQLQRRRSACSASAALEKVGKPRGSRDRSIMEEEGEEEEKTTTATATEMTANYYGKEVLKLMRRKMSGGGEGTKMAQGGGTEGIPKSASSSSSSSSLLPCPPMLFSLEDELFMAPSTFDDGMMEEAGCHHHFVGRQWLFKELCQQLITERAKLVLLVGQSGCGKSAIVQQLVAASSFWARQKMASGGGGGPANGQHNTVDSGIAVSATGTGNSSSSDSQLSLLNVSGHAIPSEHSQVPPPPPSSVCLALPSNRCSSPTPSAGRNYEWLRTLGTHVCAFHFAHLHSAISCSIADFIRSMCAQFCQSPQLKNSYGKMIRSQPNLHRLATESAAALSLSPADLFAQLILQPIGQLYEEEEKQKRNRRSAKRTNSNKQQGMMNSEFGGEGEEGIFLSDSSACSTSSSALLPPFILVVLDGLDEAGFHRTDGGESIGWLLRLSMPNWPPQLRFLATLTPGAGSLTEQSAIFGTLKDEEKPMEARTIRLDDWEIDDRLARDARLFVENRAQQNPGLDKWLNAQFRRQSFFAAPSSSCSSHPSSSTTTAEFNFHLANLAAFSSQIVQHCRANFAAIQMALGLLADGILLSLASIPPPSPSGPNNLLGPLFCLHFRHKFASTNFGQISPILSVLLASFRPLQFTELLTILNGATINSQQIGGDQLKRLLGLLCPWIIQLPVSGTIVPAHPSFRDWLIKESANGGEFAIDIRHGHILLALWLISSTAHRSPQPEQLFELAHHLLKANPHKYMHAELAKQLGMPQSRDAQVQWLRLCCGNNRKTMASALLCRRNVFYPNSKVSRLLLLAGADPNAHEWPSSADGTESANANKAAEDIPLLCSFARAGNLEMVQLLLQFGADPNLGTPSPLIVAIQNGHQPIVQLLCTNWAANMCAKDADGHGPLWHAAAIDSLPIVDFLLNTIGTEGNGAEMMPSSLTGENITMAEMEEENPTNSTSSSSGSSSAWASSSGYEEEEGQKGTTTTSNHIVSGMPNKSTTQNGQEQHRPNRMEAIREAFECAAERGSGRVCRFLLDCTDARLDTSRAMCIACANGRSEIVQFLLSRGATLAPEQTWNGKSALVCAVESGSWDLVVNVLNMAGKNAQAELNEQRGPDRLSPLMIAARHGHVGLVDLLVNRGAHLDAADAHGRTASMHAIEAGHGSTVGLLLDRGCGRNVRDGHGNTMLHLLARHPSKCLINRLLEAGLSLEDKNREDLRPIEVAIQCGQLLAVDTFLRRGARLRSLTWQIAIASHPPLVLVLLRKLLDDAQILLRRKRIAEAQHRFIYALQKCQELMEKANERRGKEEDANDNNAANGLRHIRGQLRRYKVQALHSMAALKRKANDIHEAIKLATEALDTLNNDGEEEGKRGRVRGGEMALANGCSPSASSSSASFASTEEDEAEEDEEEEEAAERHQQREEQRFELHLLLAKCHFDARDMAKAREDAKVAVCLRPKDQEAQSLLAVLTIGTTSSSSPPSQ